MNWEKIAECFELMVRVKREEWRCGVPPFGSPVDEALELAVDVWASELAKDLQAEWVPPPEVAPWLLMRMICAAMTAQQLAEQGDPDPPAFSPSTVRQFLIGEWHGHWKHRWHLMALPEWLH
jgi:hypothetical protein